MLTTLFFIDHQPKVQMKPLVSQTLVSVIIPNLNRKTELVRAINSVISQTYKAVEIVVVDDGSYFSNQQFLEAEGVRHDALRVFRNPINRGLSYSRNRGISWAKGELVAFLDSDDFWEPDKLERQIQFMHCNPDVDMVYCDTFLHINNQKVSRNTSFYDSELWDHLMSGWKPTNPSTLMMRKRSFQKNGYFDEKLRHHEDYDFWLRAADNLTVGYCKEALSNFSFDSKDRLSNEYLLKFERTGIFLKKWKPYIVSRHGLTEFERFKSDLTFNMAIETFNCSLKFRKFNNLLGVYFKYLISDKRFYQLLKNKLRRYKTKHL